MYDLVIIGGGPAGVSAALYGRARGLSVGLIEREAVGGLIGRVSVVSHFLALQEDETGRTIGARMKAQLVASGCELLTDDVTALRLDGPVRRAIGRAGLYEARAVVLAMGSSPRRLGLKGEKELGVSYCARDRTDELADREVVIVGGSDGAAKEALFLARHAKRVHLVCVEPSLVAIAEFRTAIEASSNIDVLAGSQVTSIEGEGRIQRLTVRRQSDGAETILRCDDEIPLFVYAGQTPNTALLVGELELKDGYVVTTDEVNTPLPGVYAAGDLRVKAVRQVATAAADGALAGIRAAAFVAANR